MADFKNIIKKIVPASIIRAGTGLLYGWHGDYASWFEAQKKCTGYDSETILQKVEESTIQVKNGIFPYERDSVLFSEIQYSYPILSILLWIAAINKGKLHVLDFGGSLGSSYYQNKYFLNSLSDVKWCIVEQPGFVKAGKENFEDNRLNFFYSIEECLESNDIDIILFSSVLQYLEKPFEIIEQVKSADLRFILIDRTPFIKGKNRITVQKVMPAIYHASYPCWFFNKATFLANLSDHYEMIIEFDSLDKANIRSEFKGFLFRRKKG